jgi:hypothetical protein
MTTQTEALKLALNALETDRDIYRENDEEGLNKAITAIKEALSETEQEPVAWQVMVENEAMKEFSIKDMAHDWCVHQELSGFSYTYWIRPLYTTPPQRTWVGLTDDEMYRYCPIWLGQADFKALMLHIESKLKDKNTKGQE